MYFLLYVRGKSYGPSIFNTKNLLSSRTHSTFYLVRKGVGAVSTRDLLACVGVRTGEPLCTRLTGDCTSDCELSGYTVSNAGTIGIWAHLSSRACGAHRIVA